MSKADIKFAVSLASQMDWELTESDFDFMMELEPKGCFILFDDSEMVGMATTVSFDKIGWFGNLFVNEDKRNRGAGSLLVKHAIEYLKNKKVETVGLFAYLQRISLYKRIGFECDSEFNVIKGEGFHSPDKPNITRTSKHDIEKIVSFDRSCFGASRRKMLEPILLDTNNLCYMHTKDGQISGYVVAKVFRGQSEIGPLVCRKGNIEGAVGLLRIILSRLEGAEVSMFVPEKEKAILSMLTEHGFRQSFKVERMFYGPPAVNDCIYMGESLERG